MKRPWWLLLAAMLLSSALASGSAVGKTLSFSPGGSVTLVSLGLVLFTASSITTVSCPVTLSGSLSRGPIREEAGQVLGRMTGEAWRSERCAGGHIVEAVTNWMTFHSTLVALPYRLYGLEARIGAATWTLLVYVDGISPNTCRYVGVLEGLFALSGEGPSYAVGLYTLNNPTFTLENREDLTCPPNVVMSGLFALAPETTLTEQE